MADTNWKRTYIVSSVVTLALLILIPIIFIVFAGFVGTWLVGGSVELIDASNALAGESPAVAYDSRPSPDLLSRIEITNAEVKRIDALVSEHVDASPIPISARLKTYFGSPGATACSDCDARLEEAERREQALREELDELTQQVQLARHICQADDVCAVYFALGRNDLTPHTRADITYIADRMSRGESSVIVVEGHADASGRPEDNKALSRRRAQTVARELEDLLGTGYEIRTVGRGESSLIVPTADDEPEERNRVVLVRGD